MAWRIVRVTLRRAFSAGDPVLRGLPPRPVARASSLRSASRSESVLRAGLLDELRRRLVSDQGLAYARKRLAERLGSWLEKPFALAQQRMETMDCV
jgi:hypothetical protein